MLDAGSNIASTYGESLLTGIKLNDLAPLNTEFTSIMLLPKLFAIDFIIYPKILNYC